MRFERCRCCCRALTMCVCLLGAPVDHPHTQEKHPPTPQTARVTTVAGSTITLSGAGYSSIRWRVPPSS
jgi:hypothetical protein